MMTAFEKVVLDALCSILRTFLLVFVSFAIIQSKTYFQRRHIMFPRLGLMLLYLCNHTRWFSSALSISSIMKPYQGKTLSTSKTLCHMANSSKARSEESKIIKVLALHGSGGTADEFPTRLEPLKETLQETYEMNLDIEAIQAPFEKGEGFCWWTMPPGVRSFTAEKYDGFETSEQIVLEALSSTQFDLILAHSQGAILAASLISLGKLPYHPPKGYILNGCAYCNPYSRQVESLHFEEGSAIPRVLFIMGVNDKINPNDSGEKLRDEFQRAGINCSTIQHPKGHAFPQDKDHFMQLISEWIAKP